MTHYGKNMKRIIPLLIFTILTFSVCDGKRNNNEETGNNTLEVSVNKEPDNNSNTVNVLELVPRGMYYQGHRGLSPDGKHLYIYYTEIADSQFGELYGKPLMYLYDKDNNIISIYNVSEMLDHDFFGGLIYIDYNKERNSFDLVFQYGGYGDYGSAYINLNNYEINRELLTLYD